MGLGIWLLSGAVAFVIARSIPFGRRRGRAGEAAAALLTAAMFGCIATAADFGGWREPDPRAAAFAFCGAFAAAGIVRLVRMRRGAAG